MSCGKASNVTVFCKHLPMFDLGKTLAWESLSGAVDPFLINISVSS